MKLNTELHQKTRCRLSFDKLYVNPVETASEARVFGQRALGKRDASLFNREEIATYLRRVADTLDAGDAITLSAGDQSVTMNPPSRPTFEVKAEREGPIEGTGELSVEFELEWDENGDGDGELEIE